MKRRCLFSGILLLFCSYLKAQVGTELTPIRFCEPGVSGMLPGKGLEIYQEIVPGYNLSTPVSLGSDRTLTDRVNYSHQWGIKLKIPVVLRDDFKLLVDTKFAKQNYSFLSSESLEVKLHQNLETQTLNTLRVGLLGLKPINSTSYLVGRISLSVNSNTYEDLELGWGSSAVNVTFLYGKKTRSNKEWGVGITQNVQFGRYAIYPVFMFNQTYNEKWGLEMVLPKEAYVRRNFGSSTALKMGAELDGSTYNLLLNQGDQGHIRLRQGFVRAKAQLEWKLVPMVWMSVQTGYIFPIAFDYSYSDQTVSILSTQESSWFSGISISLRAPQKKKK